MGLYDTVEVLYPMPNPPQGELQTKSFDCLMQSYCIDAEGRLWVRGNPWWDESPTPPEPQRCKYHGYVYLCENKENGRYYRAKFTDDICVGIELLENG